MLADYKFQVLYRVPDFYFRNVEKVKAAAARAKIELIPAVFSIGYSNGILAQDPNLAEGLPVVDQPYLVKNRVAVLDARPAVQIKNGSLEVTKGDQFAGFNWQDDPGVTTFADHSVRHQGRIACRLEPGKIVKGQTSPNVRLSQTVKLRPQTGYRFSCWVKTRDLAPTGSFHLLALGTGPADGSSRSTRGAWNRPRTGSASRSCSTAWTSARPTSMPASGARAKGTIWVDDLAIEELALVNILRRQGCPLTVKSADGKTTYEEGRDFEPVATPSWAGFPRRANTSSTSRADDQDHAAFADQERRPPPRELVSPRDHARLPGHVLSERAQGRENPRRPGPAAQ